MDKVRRDAGVRRGIAKLRVVLVLQKGEFADHSVTEE